MQKITSSAVLLEMEFFLYFLCVLAKAILYLVLIFT